MSDKQSIQSGASKPYRLWGGILLTLIAIFYIVFLNRHSLWNDEFITLRVMDYDYWELIKERLHRNHVPGYFVFLRFWTDLFGNGEFALRLPSAFFALAGIAVVWRLGAYLFGERQGLLVLALAGANQYVFDLGSNARMYSWLYLSAAWAAFALFRYLDSGERKYAISYGLAGLFGLLSHLLYLFIPATVILYLLRHRGRFAGKIKWAIGASLAPIAAWLPVIIWWSRVQHKVGKSGFEWGEFHLWGAFRSAGDLVLGESGWADSDSFEDLVRLIIAAGIIFLLVRFWKSLRHQFNNEKATTGTEISEAHPLRYLGLMGYWCLLPILAMTLAQLNASSNLTGVGRYYITIGPLLPILMVGVVHQLQAIGKNRIAIGYATVIVVAELIVLGAYVLYPGCGLREIAYRLRDERQVNEPVMTSRTRARTRSMIYYQGMSEMPIEKPKGVKKENTILHWIRESTPDGGGFWMIYYNGLESRVRDAILANPDEFIVLSEPYEVGETALVHYERVPGAQVAHVDDDIDYHSSDDDDEDDDVEEY